MYFFWISLFFYLFIIARILRLIVKFVIGEPPYIPGELAPVLEGDAFILESIYTIISYIGLFFIYYAMEKNIVKKTHFMFSILVCVTCVVSIVDFITRDLLWLTMPFFIATVLGLPIIFIVLAIKSSGSVRKNAIFVVIGLVLFILGIAMDIPDAKAILGTWPSEFLLLAPPIFQIIALYFFRKGFQTRI